MRGALVWTLTQPQWLSLGVEEEALALPLVGGGHVEVAADDALQVAVLPVEVTALDRPGEHGSSGPGQGVCKERNHQCPGGAGAACSYSQT